MKNFTVREYAIALEKWPEGQERAVRLSMIEEMNKLAAYIKRTFFRKRGKRSPDVVISRSGRTERSIRGEVKRPAWGAMVGSVTMGGAGIYLEYGTGIYGKRGRPYVIVPRKAGGVLRFELEDGTVVFTRRVVHKGVRPRAPLGRGVAQRQSYIYQNLVRAHEVQLAKSFGGY